MIQEPKIFPYIARLLQGDEVVWKPLGEVVTTITAPTKLNRSEYKQEGSIPIIDQGIDFIAGYTDESFTPVKSDTYILFGDHSEHIKYVDFAFIQGADGLKILKPKEDNAKYIYYAFINFYHKQLNYKRHWSVAKETIIPLPPLSVQQEIVRILDKFTQLEAELEAELDCRKRQYEYYRNKLLSYEGNEVEWKTLGEVFEIAAGGDIPKDSLSEIETNECSVPILSNGTNEKAIYGWTNIPKINKPSITISARGTIGWASYRGQPFFPIVRLLVLTPLIEMHLKYAYHYMKSIENNYKVPKVGIPQLTKPMIKDLKIPLPPLEEQQRIASILDKFDTLVNSISEGLPKEIALRRKQYEYYREKLLSFSKE